MSDLSWTASATQTTVGILSGTPGSLTTSSTTISATPSRTIFPFDPYLAFQPPFAYSLPIQILLTGIIASLATVLLMHLIFTAPYHWPLAKLNFALQLSGVVSLLISIASSLYVLLNELHTFSREWPYMFNYVAVVLPPDSWSPNQLAWWYSLDALTSALAHITHIQFLTLLYPSKLEVWLIFLLLGPLALASSASSYIALTERPFTHAIGESLRNVCNSTLALLFTIALCIWGLYINRKEAWRTDGGTAIFGAGALLLALFSVGLNLLQIAQVPPIWMPGLAWAIVLWQSFLGWWWWVGSGTPSPKKKSKKKKRRKSRESSDGQPVDRFSRIKSGIESLRRRTFSGTGGSNLSRHNTIEQSFTTADDTTSNHSHTTSPGRPGVLASFIPAWLSNWWRQIRRAHFHASRMQAIDNMNRRMHVYGQENATSGSTGWALGSYALRERRALEESDEGHSLEMNTVNGEGRTIGSSAYPPGDTLPGPPPGPNRQSSATGWNQRSFLQRWRLQDLSVYH